MFDHLLERFKTNQPNAVARAESFQNISKIETNEYVSLYLKHDDMNYNCIAALFFCC